MKFITYAIYSITLDKIYVGQTNNIDRRIKEHKNGYSTYTSNARDWKLIYQKSFTSRSSAMKREKQLKSFRGREFLKNLV